MYKVEWSEEAKKGLSKIGDRVKIEKIKKAVGELAKDPYKGDRLKYDLKGQRSLHLLGNRVRVIYEIYQAKLLILVVKVGWREGFY